MFHTAINQFLIEPIPFFYISFFISCCCAFYYQQFYKKVSKLELSARLNLGNIKKNCLQQSGIDV